MKRTAQTAKFIHGIEMKPCPSCGAFNMHYRMPIQMKEPILATDGARQILGKWARSIKDGNTPLEGPCFMVCEDCGHKGPSIDCSGRTSEDVGKDPLVASEIKRIWNSQTTVSPSQSDQVAGP